MVEYFNEAEHVDDPFNEFTDYWRALVSALPSRGRHNVRNDNENALVLQYLQARTPQVVKALEICQETMSTIAGRKGSQYRNSIIDHGDPNARSMLERLSRHYREGAPMDSEEIVTAIGKMLVQVRNNTIHAEKSRKNANDMALVKRASEILRQILIECEGLG